MWNLGAAYITYTNGSKKYNLSEYARSVKIVINVQKWYNIFF